MSGRPRPTRPVPGAEGYEEADGRRGDVALGGGAIVPAWRETDPDHRQRRVDCLQRVVPRSEERAERAGGALLRPRELRPPERRLVGLVADDELPDGRIPLGELAEPCAECLGPREPRLHLAGRVRIGREHDAQAGRARGSDRQVEERPLTERERVARQPADGHHRLPKPQRRHLSVERRPGVRCELAGVVVRPDVGGSRRARADERQQNGCDERARARPPPVDCTCRRPPS